MSFKYRIFFLSVIMAFVILSIFKFSYILRIHSDPSLPLNVILLAYQRSGSSFTGEILSLATGAAYFFEPLFYTDIVQMNQTPEAQLALLNNILECNENTLQELQTKSTLRIIRKFGMEDFDPELHEYKQACLKSPIRIIKTIRLRMNVAQHLLNDENLKVKIIHLVRDPRAILYSMLGRPKVWPPGLRTPSTQCSIIGDDLEIGRFTPSENYLLIRYEDLVTNLLNETKRIFKFLGVDFPQEKFHQYTVLHNHAESNNKTVLSSGKYFDTFRNSSFDINHWKKDASAEYIREIEEQCDWIINTLGYELIQLNSEE